jgi:cyclopropane fatty-acyl-phospholipid synthase-like methyltransferase
MANRPSNRARNRWAADVLDVRPADRVLEIGFGPGLALLAILERATQGRVVGIDHSELMLRQAETRNRAALAAGRLELRLGGLELLPTLGGPFDRVLSVNVVQFFADRAAAFAAIRDVLAPGGVMATVYQPRHGGATAADADRMAQALARLATDAGLVSVRIERLEAKPLPAVCVLAQKGLG